MTTTPSRAGYVEEYRTTLKNTKGALAARLAIFNEDNALLVAMVEKQAQGLAEAEKALSPATSDLWPLPSGKVSLEKHRSPSAPFDLWARE